jgi:Protein of unknown function (DUF2934)
LNKLLKIKEANMTNTNGHPKKVNHSEIAVVAYQMWEAAGQPTSRDLQFWLDAEAQLRAAAKAPVVTPAAHPSRVDSRNHAADKAAKVQLGLRQANSSAPQQKVRRF